MLVNEALDALQKGVASAEDIDTAMRLGVNYPRGPLAWGESLGWGRVLRLLENLQQHYGEALSPLFPAAPEGADGEDIMSNEAWRNARAMYENDNCAKALGIEIIEMDEGYAQMTMAIAPNMLNGHHTCHGGQLFSLADTAFAYACNSQGLAAVASAASIDFLRPAFVGELLTATARVKQQGKLTGVYDIEIVNQQQKIVALFRGKSHRIGGTITGEV
jgi:acyl-CoA thioesterase